MQQKQDYKLTDILLVFCAKNKYVTRSLAEYYFNQYSRSHIEKTLKRLYDRKFLLRKTIDREPIKGSREYVYYLSKKGAQQVLFSSVLFGGIEEMNMGSGNINFVFHELCVSWIAAIWEKQSKDYEDVYFRNLEIETRRSFLQYENVIPDLRISINKDNEQVVYFLEIDNFTVQKKEWQRRCVYYQKMLNHNNYLLIITTRFNPRRLSKLLNIAYRYLDSSKVFATSLESVYQSSYLANIWYKDVELRITAHLPL